MKLTILFIFFSIPIYSQLLDSLTVNTNRTTTNNVNMIKMGNNICMTYRRDRDLL